MLNGRLRHYLLVSWFRMLLRNQSIHNTTPSDGLVAGRIEADSYAESNGTVFFLIRGARAKDDITFWHAIELLLPVDARIGLLGFCDGEACANALRECHTCLFDFPVIEYGEIVSSQAVVDADNEGEAIRLSHDKKTFAKVPWRASGLTARQIVRAVCQGQ